jgi:hypothetical protein
MKLSSAVALAAIVGCAILLFVVIRTREELAIANAALASVKSANSDLSARNTELEKQRVDEAMLKRLEADQRDAIKLRGEVASLKKSLATAESAAAAAAAAQRLATQKAESDQKQPASTENPYTRVFARKFTANLPLGHAAVFGGWQTEPGKQVFAVAIPNRDPNPNAQEIVSVQAKWLEISDEALSKLDTTMLLRAAGQQTTLSPEQLEAFMKSLEQTTGADVLGAPNVTVVSGRPARVSIRNSMTAPDGTVIELGPSMDLVPTLAADGSSVNLAVDAKLTLPNVNAASKQ